MAEVDFPLADSSESAPLGKIAFVESPPACPALATWASTARQPGSGSVPAGPRPGDRCSPSVDQPFNQWAWTETLIWALPTSQSAGIWASCPGYDTPFMRKPVSSTTHLRTHHPHGPLLKPRPSLLNRLRAS